jgi:hypothetical protein
MGSLQSSKRRSDASDLNLKPIQVRLKLNRDRGSITSLMGRVMGSIRESSRDENIEISEDDTPKSKQRSKDKDIDNFNNLLEFVTIKH